MSEKIQVLYEATPNPQSMKFNFTCQISNETAFFDNPALAARSPLAQKVFGFPWAQSVMIGPYFVTITKQDWVDWTVIADPLADLLAEHLERKEGVLLELDTVDSTTEGSSHIEGNDSEIVQQIKKILDNEIRPAVAMDGGDIIFSRYENNRLYLKLQGSCSGCPSSVITLKEGIESRMKQSIPELVEVIDDASMPAL